MRTEKRSSLQISGDMVSLHHVVSPHNGDTQGGPPPPPLLATPLLLGFLCFFTFLLAFLGFTAFSLSFLINSSKNAESCRTIALSCKSISHRMKPVQHLTENIYIYDVIVAEVYIRCHSKWFRITLEVNSYYIGSEFVLHSKSPPRMSSKQAEFAFRPIRSDSGSVWLGYKAHFQCKKNNHCFGSSWTHICGDIGHVNRGYMGLVGLLLFCLDFFFLSWSIGHMLFYMHWCFSNQIRIYLRCISETMVVENIEWSSNLALWKQITWINFFIFLSDMSLSRSQSHLFEVFLIYPK